jgi:NAD(P)-dependent dehydrogenase (short-subunit alcohol dehydrogenase family)
MELDGKIALITGAGSVGGIGAVTAQLFASEGAEIIIAARDAERARAVIESIEAEGGKARAIIADLTDVEAVRGLADEAGAVDILVNNAGTAPIVRPTTEPDLDYLANAFEINVRAPYLLTGAVAGPMAARGSGSIINMSNMVARFAIPGLSVHGAAKAALESLTRSWAAELAGAGVRVNAVSGGPILSARVLAAPGGLERLSQMTALKRAGTPSEIAQIALFLASDRSSYITGTIVTADGGRVAI